jgi:hypothetical protein
MECQINIEIADLDLFSIIFGYMLIGCLYLCDMSCRFVQARPAVGANNMRNDHSGVPFRTCTTSPSAK